MARTLKVKVPVATLLASAQNERAALVADHARGLKKYERDQAQFAARARAALDKAFTSFMKDGPPPHRTGYISGRYRPVVVVPGYPKNPEEPSLDTKGIDRDIAILAAASDEFLSISTDDHFARYLGGIA